MACTCSVWLTGEVCPALGFRIPTVTEVVCAGTVMLLCSSLEETKMVGTLAPATDSCDVVTKPEPSTSSKKLLPTTLCVMDPDEKPGSTFQILTVSDAEDPL